MDHRVKQSWRLLAPSSLVSFYMALNEPTIHDPAHAGWARRPRGESDSACIAVLSDAELYSRVGTSPLRVVGFFSSGRYRFVTKHHCQRLRRCQNAFCTPYPLLSALAAWSRRGFFRCALIVDPILLISTKSFSSCTRLAFSSNLWQEVYS